MATMLKTTDHQCSQVHVGIFQITPLIFYLTGFASCKWNEPHHDKTSNMACASSKDSDQPGHPPSLIRIFAVCLKKAWVLSYPLSAQRRLTNLGRCLGWSESSLGAHAISLVLSKCGSDNISGIYVRKWVLKKDGVFFSDFVTQFYCIWIYLN